MNSTERREKYTSNLINNEEMAARFTEEAFMVACSLRTKYYSLFNFMSEDDIVMECWDKILRQDIGFDESRRCKFSSFVRMLVNNRCIDLCRKIEKHEGIVSLDAALFNSTEDPDKATLADFISDSTSEDAYTGLAARDVILSLDVDFNSLRVSEIAEMLEQGYTASDISDTLNVSPSDVRAVKVHLGKTFHSRYDGSGKPLAEILFGDEEVLAGRRDELMKTLCYVKEGRLKLSDIVGLIIDGYSYKGISEKLHSSEDIIKSFLDRCLSIVV